MSEESNRQLWLAVRRGLLMIVQAIEKTFGLKETEDAMNKR